MKKLFLALAVVCSFLFVTVTQSMGTPAQSHHVNKQVMKSGISEDKPAGDMGKGEKPAKKKGKKAKKEEQSKKQEAPAK